MVEQKVWKKEDIKALLEKYPNAVLKGIKTIYKLQTEDEKRSEATRHHNGIGFSGADAGIMSSFAKQLNEGRNLTEKQLVIARKKILKYAGQLAKIANKELEVG